MCGIDMILINRTNCLRPASVLTRLKLHIAMLLKVDLWPQYQKWNKQDTWCVSLLLLILYLIQHFLPKNQVVQEQPIKLARIICRILETMSTVSAERSNLWQDLWPVVASLPEIDLYVYIFLSSYITHWLTTRLRKWVDALSGENECMSMHDQNDFSMIFRLVTAFHLAFQSHVCFRFHTHPDSQVHFYNVYVITWFPLDRAPTERSAWSTNKVHERKKDENSK